MALVFNIAMHALLVGAMLAFLFTLVAMVLRTEQPVERLRRGLALFAGAMVVVGAQASGASFAIFTTDSLGNARGASLAANVVSAVIPAVAGAALGFFIVRKYRTNEAFAMRIICFIGTLALAAFAEVYAQATNTHGVFLGAAALPNLSFTVGVVLMFIFGPETTTDKNARGATSSPSFLQTAKKFFTTRGNGVVDTPVPAAQETPGPRRDPFAF
jgi:cytochrome bd-type quinol oxidase subunit 2